MGPVQLVHYNLTTRSGPSANLGQPQPTSTKSAEGPSKCSGFPREVHLTTEVDVNDGSVKLKKLEMVNNVTPAVTYVLGCNTDVTCLLSGTSIKAVVAYISDYVTKSSLKTYHVFQSVQNVFDRNTVCLGGSPQTKKNARVLIMQMVNSLSPKLQIGSPMASMYLLGTPDHYTNLDCKVFWWKSYVKEVMKSWPSSEPSLESDRLDDDEDEERVVVAKGADGFVGITNVDDYVHRPAAVKNMSLYDFFQISEPKKRTPKQHKKFLESLEDSPPVVKTSDVEKDSDDNVELDIQEIELETVSEIIPEISSGPFMPDHPLYKTHYLIIDKRKLSTTVPHFAGGGLPRADQGDRDHYCCTMMTLLRPWGN
ncbi:hypothetical protein B0H13DRAFT_1587158 [Mycena leptocephala]|nr:hypothetical protein B0H13DRAFT_1587158 [Mycena leptocephala]